MPYSYQARRDPVPYEELGDVDVRALPCDVGADRLAQLIDNAFDRKDLDLLQKAPQWAGALLGRSDLTPQARVDINYYLGNYWYFSQLLADEATDASTSHATLREIFHLRCAVNDDAFDEVNRGRRAQILTNLGNVLSNVGRTAEALEAWEAALAAVDNFGMALANRGHGLYLYTFDLVDPHEIVLFLREARSNLAAALQLPLEGAAPGLFQSTLNEVEAVLERRDDDHIVFPGASETPPGEQMYRTWCAAHRLFLTPLNDIDGGLAVARDDVMASPIIVPVDQGPRYLGFLSQLKQEFVSARYFAYEGMHAAGPHFSDYDVTLANTLDYPSFSLSAEREKAAFRSAYSIFDKIAYFINAYLELGIPERRVTFKSLWFEKQDPARWIRAEIDLERNRPLRALYWLSRDLHETREGFQNVMDPEASELATVRNHLEHKYLKLHLFDWDPRLDGLRDTTGDDLAYSMLRSDFEDRLIRLLRMSRCAILYLCCAVTREERLRNRASDRNPTLPMKVPVLEDSLKV